MRGRAGRTTVACCALVAGLGSAPTATAAERYDFRGSEFVLRLSAAAVQAQTDVPQAIPTSLGYSAVGLAKDLDVPYAQCRVVGAGVHLPEYSPPGLIENNGPPDAGGGRRAALYPIEARDTAPNLSPGEWHSRRPQLPDQNDVRGMLDDAGLGEERLPWAAHCETDAAGTARGNDGDTTGAAGSTTTGALDKMTGTYVGTSRAFVASVTTPSGTVTALSSTVRVTHRAGKTPVLDYRIAANGGTLAAGSGVPVQDLTRQFNEQARENAAAVAAVGTLGLTLVGPTESESDDHAHRIVHFPFVEVSAGLKAREGGIGQGQRVRLLTVAYEGAHHKGTVGGLG